MNSLTQHFSACLLCWQRSNTHREDICFIQLMIQKLVPSKNSFSANLKYLSIPGLLVARCGSLNVIGPSKPIESGTVRCAFVGVGVVLLEEVSLWGRFWGLLCSSYAQWHSLFPVACGSRCRTLRYFTSLTSACRPPGPTIVLMTKALNWAALSLVLILKNCCGHGVSSQLLNSH